MKKVKIVGLITALISAAVMALSGDMQYAVGIASAALSSAGALNAVD